MSEPIDDEIIYWTDVRTGEVWKRTGYCSQCGDCCEDDHNLFKNCDGNYDYSKPLTQVVEGKCAYFRWKTDGKAECTGRDTTYYQCGCKFHPVKPSAIVPWPNCTYKFTKIDPLTESYGN